MKLPFLLYAIAACLSITATFPAQDACAETTPPRHSEALHSTSPIVPSSFKSSGIEFQLVPAGCFQMGDTSGDSDEKPVHQVCLSSFYIGKYEVTQGLWQQVMGSNPSFFSSCGENCPAESINWHDIQRFISKLNLISGKTYRLPTEAEWEYACRSGGKPDRYCGSNEADGIAWFDRNSSSKPHAVGQKKPNALGIYDMSGNVWEWVNDRYQKSYYEESPTSNPAGPEKGAKRGIRGGSWYNDSNSIRASVRSSDEPEHRSINLGFRLALTE